MTWYDFAECILKEIKSRNKPNLIVVNDYVTFAKRPKYSVLLNSKPVTD